MKAAWILALILAVTTLAAGKEPISVTVIVEAEADDAGSEYVEVKMEVQHKHESLQIALSEVFKINKQVENLVMDYCTRGGGKSKCKEAVEISNYEIEAKYQQIKKEDTFVGTE